MKPLLYSFLFAALATSAMATGTPSTAAPAPVTTPAPATKAALTITAEGIDKNGVIGQDYAFCIPADPGHIKDGPDKSIGLAWSHGPEGTKSYAIIGVDTDVPTVFDDANKEGKTVSAAAARRNFYHWVLLDIPLDTLQIPANMDSQGIVQHGKEVFKTPFGTRGVNDYAGYFAADPNRKGIYTGYDGPCPPWNDELVHHYHFKVYALDVATLGLKDPVTGAQAEAAIAKHSLAEGEVVGTYTLNPALQK